MTEKKLKWAGGPPCLPDRTERGPRPKRRPFASEVRHGGLNLTMPSEALGADQAVLLGGEAVTARAEVVADGAEGLQEPLGVLRGFEALERPFSLTHWPV